MELFKLLGTIAIDNANAKKALDETSEKGEKSESKLSKAFSKIGSAAVKVGKTIAVGLAAGVTAIAGLVTKSVQAYADYEQLVGGVETLFGTGGLSLEEYADSVGKTVDEIRSEYETLVSSQETVLQNATNAYKTAGMSANEYMETVTSFSASLLQSLDNDTAAAAKYADQVIVDMSDNANKMGTDMEAIQNAYQGFAKQNYTMLDNLKLGYGGTKEEMARLIADANKVKKANGEMADLSIDSFADITEAIHIIQTEMGITGTTAKEASTTIQGSISSMKSAWQNLLVAVSSDDLPFDDYVNAFVDSVSTVADNLLPRIEIALGGVVQLVDQLAPKIIDALPGLLSTLLPAVVEAATSLIMAISDALPGLITVLVDLIPDLIAAFVTIFDALVSALPELMESIVSALPSLLPNLIDGIYSMIITLAENLMDIIQPLIDYMPEIVGAIVEATVENLPALIEAGGQLLLGLLDGMISLISNIPAVLSSIWDAIVGGIKDLFGIHSPSTVMADIGGNIMDGLLNGISDMIGKVGEIAGEIKEKITEKFDALKEKAGEIWDNIKKGASEKWESIKSTVSEKASGLKENATTAFNTLKDKVSSTASTAKDKVSSAWSSLKEKTSSAFSSAKDVASYAWEALKSKVSDTATNAKDTVSSAWSTLKDNTSSWFNSAKDTATSAFDTLKSEIAGDASSAGDSAASSFDSMKNNISTAINAAKSTVSSVFSNIKSTISDGVNGALSTVTSKFDNIKSNITEKIQAARDTVKEAIERIKGFFNFEFTWPKLKMPHFGISPSGWQVGDLLKGSIPKLSIEWYSKAMNNPLLMNSPTIFGYDPETGQAKGGGETGSEVVSGTNTLMNMIGSVVENKTAAQNERIVSVLMALLDAIVGGNEELLKALLSGQVIKLNEREVGRTVREYA